MPKDTPWDRHLSVTSDGEGLIGHAGAVLLRKLADQAGLTAALGSALARRGKFPLVDRGVALVSMAVAIVLGATSMTDITVLAHHALVLGAEPSDTTVRRTLELADPRTLDRVARVRAKVRAHVWSLIRARPAGFPWLEVAAKLLAGWLVIDLDGTLITARSDKEGAAPTFKMGYGFHPLGAWCANTAESLAMLLRPGNAGSNTFADHLTVLTAAIRQIPARMRSRLLVRVDGAGASHELITHLLSLASQCRIVLFTCGWAITEADEAAIGLLPAAAWQAAVDQDGVVQDDKHVAEITHLLSRAAGWPDGLRWIVRRTKPSRRQAKNLTAFERATGWRYSIIVTNIPDTGIKGVPGSHHAQFIDVLHRQHAVVEDGVRAGKSMGLRNLPSKTWVVNCGWVLAANLAADLAAWCRLLGLYDCDDLKDAEPDTLRYRLWALPARLVRHARSRRLKISRTWPWKDAFLTCWRRLCALPAPT
jgi:Transposase DDE domain group 1